MASPAFCGIFLLLLSYLKLPFCVYFAQQYLMKNIAPFPIPFSKTFSMIESKYYSPYYSYLPMFVTCWQEITWQNQNLYSHFARLDTKYFRLKRTFREGYLQLGFHTQRLILLAIQLGDCCSKNYFI